VASMICSAILQARNGCVCYFELVGEKDAFWGRGSAMVAPVLAAPLQLS
jgi:hypothetical protein